MDKPIGTLEEGSYKAEIYEGDMPGQFTVHYLGPKGSVLAEEPLTGVSSYHQRELEIRRRLIELSKGHELKGSPLSDSGEY